MAEASRERLSQLTGLRYFAAILVFVSHLQWDESGSFLRTLFRSGYVGVSFFFVLSGFIIAYSYQDKVISQSISKRRYLLLRVARLTPLYFATTAPFVALAIRSESLDPLALVASILYLQSWVPLSFVYFSFNAPSWSLSNEMFFYACFPFLASLSLKGLIRFGVVLLAVVLACAGIVSIWLDGASVPGSSQTLAHWLFYIFPGFRILEFISGMVIFRIWRIGYVPRPSHVVPAYVVLFALMYFAGDVPESFRMSLYFLPAIAFFLFVHLQSGGRIVRFLGGGVMVLLGNASFAFYLIHQPLLVILSRWNSRVGLGDFGFFAVSLAVVTLCSVGVFLTYEKWAERRLKNLIYRIA